MARANDEIFPDCTGDKTCYPSERSAWRTAVHAMRLRGRRLRTYFCRDCRAWHLTKESKVNYEPVR